MSRLDWRKAKWPSVDPANSEVPADYGVEPDAKSGRKAPPPKEGGFKFPKGELKNERAFPDARDGSFKGKNGGKWPKKP